MTKKLVKCTSEEYPQCPKKILSHTKLANENGRGRKKKEQNQNHQDLVESFWDPELFLDFTTKKWAINPGKNTM